MVAQADCSTLLLQLDHAPTEVVLTGQYVDVLKLMYHMRTNGDVLDHDLLVTVLIILGGRPPPKWTPEAAAFALPCPLLWRVRAHRSGHFCSATRTPLHTIMMVANDTRTNDSHSRGASQRTAFVAKCARGPRGCAARSPDAFSPTCQGNHARRRRRTR